MSVASAASEGMRLAIGIYLDRYPAGTFGADDGEKLRAVMEHENPQLKTDKIWGGLYDENYRLTLLELAAADEQRRMAAAAAPEEKRSVRDEFAIVATSELQTAIAADADFWAFWVCWTDACAQSDQLARVLDLFRHHTEDEIDLYSSYMVEVKRTLAIDESE